LCLAFYSLVFYFVIVLIIIQGLTALVKNNKMSNMTIINYLGLFLSIGLMLVLLFKGGSKDKDQDAFKGKEKEIKKNNKIEKEEAVAETL
jgi:hypothetical protein